MLTYVEEEIYDHLGEYDAILVGTNTYCTLSQGGLQFHMKLNHPYVDEANMKTKYGDKAKMGTIVECPPDVEGEPLVVLCYITFGYNFRPDISDDYLSYESLEKCLSIVNRNYGGKRLACPLLGSSRFDGNGDGARIREIFGRHNANIDLTVYDFKQKSRAEMMKEVYDAEQEARKTDKDKYYDMVRERKRLAEERYKRNKHRRY